MGWFGNNTSDEDKDAIIKGLKSRVKELETVVNDYEEEERDFREDFYGRERVTAKRHARELEEKDDACDLKIKKANTANEEKIEKIERDANKRVRDAEDKAATAIREAKATTEKTEVAVSKAVLEEKTKQLGVVTDLKVTAAQEEARADVAEELVEGLQYELGAMTTLMTEFAKTNQGFAEKVMAKLPTVDLSKFSVNVEMPAPEVTVVNAGQPKGNEQGKK